MMVKTVNNCYRLNQLDGCFSNKFKIQCVTPDHHQETIIPSDHTPNHHTPDLHPPDLPTPNS